MSVRQLGRFAAIPAVLVSSLAVRQSQSNSTVPPETLSLHEELANCSSDIVIPVLQFIITNYIAHVFTIRFNPGYRPFYISIFAVQALVFPCFGLLMACRTLENLAYLEDDPLDCALEAGALCTVARTKEWKPEKDDRIYLS